MRAVDVTAPDGERWRVRVVWEPRWRALARRIGGWRHQRRRGWWGRNGADAVDAAGESSNALTSSDDPLGFTILAVLVVVLVGALLFWWVLLPLLLVVLDLVIVLLLLVLGIVGRVLFRRPWMVEAEGSAGGTVTTNVVGWRAALRQRDEIADGLRRGVRPVVTGAGPISPG